MRTPRRKRRGPAPKVARYNGTFGREQAERLLWRAGMGPRPGELERLTGMGMRKAVLSLTRPPKAQLAGPAPRDDKGRPIYPVDAWGHDTLWWLDRMIRSNQPLVERMTLNWHDWFATSGDASNAKLMIKQNKLLRRHALGNFHKLLIGVTKDPAMLLWLSGTSNNKYEPNENYAREVMELFTLGPGAYTERDVREQARALTGFRNEWSDNIGPYKFRYDKEFHDDGVKKVFGRRGRYGWKDSLRLCVNHRRHPSFFVTKMWSYFIPTKPSKTTKRQLERMYRYHGHDVRPVVEAILMHPDFYRGPRMVKPPAVRIAGMLRAQGRGIDDDSWTWVSQLAGQHLFYPPNVAGWDESRWLDTATWRGHWIAITYAIDKLSIDPDNAAQYPQETADEAVAKALAFWGNPTVSAATRNELLGFAQRCEAAADKRWKKDPYRVMRQNALRMLVASSPEYLTS